MNGNFSEAVIHRILKKLSAHGVYAEIFAEETERLAAVFENGKPDRLENTIEQGVAFRLIDGGKTFFGYTTDTDEMSLWDTAEALLYSVRNGARDISFGNPVSVKNYKTLSRLPIEKKIAIISEMDRAASVDACIIQKTSMYSEVVRNTRVINSLGDDISQGLNYVTAYTVATASDGKTMQTAYIPEGGAFGAEEAGNIDFASIGERAGKLAMQNLRAKNAPAGMMPVVLGSKAGGTMVHEAVGHGLEADLACNGMSVFAGRLGEKVASELISVVDNGTLTDRRGSYLYDDEGTSSSENVLIENGILKSYMYDRLYAMKEGKKPTGNGRRQGFRYKPIVRMTNTYIKPGASKPEDIIASVRKGLYVAGMGGGQVNTVTGDFVFEVTEGYLIENGRMGEPVRNATLTGNGPEVMAKIDMVGSDLGFGMGTCGKEGQGVPVTDAQPTLRIPEITVGGR
ncbi:MAG: TldD/PmbA family protein [Deferribacterales bacterium]